MDSSSSVAGSAGPSPIVGQVPGVVPAGVAAGPGGAPRPPTGEEIRLQVAKEREEQLKQAQEATKEGTRRSLTIGKLAAALATAQGAMQNAARDSTNPHFKSKFASLASTWDACRAHLSANNLAVVQTVKTSGLVVVVTTLLAHSSGEWIEESLTMLAQQNTPQGVGSVITYARRYGLAAMVGVAPEDDDGQTGSTDLANTKQDTGRTSTLQQSVATGVSDEIKDPSAAPPKVGQVARPQPPRPTPAAGTVPPPPPGPKPPERAPGS